MASREERPAANTANKLMSASKIPVVIIDSTYGKEQEMLQFDDEKHPLLAFVTPFIRISDRTRQSV